MFVLALIALYAVAVQLRRTLDANDSPTNFFSLFTIQSSIYAALVLIFAPGRPLLRGAATLYMTITGVVFVVVLRDHNLIPWVNTMLHYVMPAVMLIAWLIDPPLLLWSYPRIAAVWLIYPTAYALYSLVRGARTGWYPYPFLDPRTSSLGGVAIAIASIAVFAAVIALCIAWYAKHRRSALQPP